MKNYILLISMHADTAMPPGYDEWGGTHTYMKELLDNFGKMNIPCIFITRKSMRYFPSREQYNHCCRIIRLTNGDNEPMSKLELHRYHRENLNKILDIIYAQDGLPCVIHSVYWNSGRLAMELSSLLNIPFVHSVISNSRGRVSRGAKEPIPMREGYEQEVYERAHIILCVSEDEKNDLIKFYRIPQDKLIVCGQYIAPSFLYPAHDMNGFPRIYADLTEQEQKLTAETYNKALMRQETGSYFWLYKAFTYLGRMDMNKGVVPILRAWYSLTKIYGEQCPPLWMAGGSLSEIEDIRQKAIEYIPDLNLLERNHTLVWWGYLDTEGLSTILLKTQAVITHSLYEPGGRVAVEAMSEGVPVLATPNGFAKDIICDWKNGFLIEYGNIQQLASRMEHFIRQPLLGNSLGLTARESAEKVIELWDFMQNHLFAYGLSGKPDSAPTLAQEHAYYVHRVIRIYPFNTSPLSDEYIGRIFQKSHNASIINIKDIETGICTSDMKLLSASDGEYIVKHVVARLATSPFYNPFLKDQLVRDAQEHFDIEMNIYKRLKSEIFICGNSFHHLIYLRRLHSMDASDAEYLESCINYLATRKNILTDYEKERFSELVQENMDSFENIESVLRELNSQLPGFYFECSGMFSNRLSWSLAPHLLDYNRKKIEPSTLARLTEISNYFHSISYNIDCTTLRDINLDIERRHLMTDGKNIHLIDHEKTSIGIVEMDISSYLYDYYRNNNDINITRLCEKASVCLSRLNLRKKEIISAIAYRIFYDMTAGIVLECSPQDHLFYPLEALQRIMEAASG